MGLLTTDCLWRTRAGRPSVTCLPFARKLNGHCDFQNFLPVALCSISPYRQRLGVKTRVFASNKSVKKLRRRGEVHKNAISRPNKHAPDEFELADNSPSGDASVQDNSKTSTLDNLDSLNSTSIPSRISVLQACSVTSALIAALGVIIRQGSHVASVEGWPIVDCSTEISFSFQMWHLELITGLVMLISSCRYFLLKTWPDFAESSEAANQQVLSSLKPLDYVVVASLSGFSEELLFRGAMLPVIGVNWKSALVVAIIFGLLHLGSGRKYSFAVWYLSCLNDQIAFNNIRGQHLLGLSMVMLQFYLQASSFQWLLMRQTT